MCYFLNIIFTDLGVRNPGLDHNISHHHSDSRLFWQVRREFQGSLSKDMLSLAQQGIDSFCQSGMGSRRSQLTLRKFSCVFDAFPGSRSSISQSLLRLLQGLLVLSLAVLYLLLTSFLSSWFWRTLCCYSGSVWQQAYGFYPSPSFNPCFILYFLYYNLRIIIAVNT